jgi:succinate-acetate transporter protein
MTSTEQSDGIRPEAIARVFVRPLGSVLPLGFMVFGVGALLTASYALGWIAPTEGVRVFTLLLVFVVPVEAVAAIFAFLARDTAGGTTMAVFAATWASLSITSLSLQPGQTSSAVGVLLLGDGGLIVILVIGALFANPAFALVLSIACARFVINGIYELTGNTGFEHAAGWVGLVLAAVAGYAGLAFLLEDARHEPVLPLIRAGGARQALDADLIDHLRRLESEPGVRTRL